MILAETGNTSDLILLGFFGIFLALGFWIRSVFARRVREETLLGAKTEEPEDPKAADRANARVDRFEIRLHEYSRDVEARMETRLARLDRLVVSADQEICRLEDLLEKKGNRNPQSGPDIITGGSEGMETTDNRIREPLTSWQRRMVWHLQEAGYAPREIAVLLDRPEDEVVASLEFERQVQSRGAA